MSRNDARNNEKHKIFAPHYQGFLERWIIKQTGDAETIRASYTAEQRKIYWESLTTKYDKNSPSILRHRTLK